MQKISLFSLTLLTAACTMQTPDEPLIGVSRDQHGCNRAAGLSDSHLLQKCLQPWDAASIKLDDPDHPGLAVYVLISQDQAAAEVFAVDSEDKTALLQPVKGGFSSPYYRLLKSADGWTFRRTAR